MKTNRPAAKCDAISPLGTSGREQQRNPRTQAHRRLSFLALLVGFAVGRAAAETYSIDWSTIDGGGGTSTGGVYSVSGTIGQPDAGHMNGGNYTLDGGFWGLIAATQTPSAPTLTITRSGTSIIISWPSPSTGFGLQQNSNLVSTGGWSAFSGTINDNGTTKSITINPPVGNLFFRLKQQ